MIWRIRFCKISSLNKKKRKGLLIKARAIVEQNLYLSIISTNTVLQAIYPHNIISTKCNTSFLQNNFNTKVRRFDKHRTQIYTKINYENIIFCAFEKLEYQFLQLKERKLAPK